MHKTERPVLIVALQTLIPAQDYAGPTGNRGGKRKINEVDGAISDTVTLVRRMALSSVVWRAGPLMLGICSMVTAGVSLAGLRTGSDSQTQC